jgi:serine/threonine-protein kinase
MGELVNRHGYVHHFNIGQQDIRSPQAFLSNICAQLIVRYRLNYPVLPPDAAKNSEFLSQLLTEAAAQPQNVPLVVLVDALDEAEDSGLAPQANRLYSSTFFT